MEARKLGSQGLVASAQGLGCMGMSEFYGQGDETESIATIHRALELGVTLLDTADMYGAGANERLVGEAIADRRDQVVLATKFGVVRDPDSHELDDTEDAPRIRPAAAQSERAVRETLLGRAERHRTFVRPIAEAALTLTRRGCRLAAPSASGVCLASGGSFAADAKPGAI